MSLALDLEDPRTGNAGLHDLLEMLFIALSTVLSGDNPLWTWRCLQGRRRRSLREFLKLDPVLKCDCPGTQAELERRVRCQQQTIDKIERGLTERSRLLPRIAPELGLPLDRIA